MKHSESNFLEDSVLWGAFFVSLGAFSIVLNEVANDNLVKVIFIVIGVVNLGIGIRIVHKNMSD